ncbi:endonuclease/exonuclease/phosphatase family protein [Actinoplanes sp. NPDC023801]|uniref:endonuclease/exonuclease/phosphatase family protein n=1 Tax=Actinoplanes sp. NPDC023801 TaxID=3154595 RepID=UPI0033E74471
MRLYQRLAVAAATALLAVGGAVMPGAPAAAAVNATYNFWVWNVAGSTMHGGSTTDGLIDAAAGSIINRDADFVAFNEICEGQYHALIARLRELNYPADESNFARFSPSNNAVEGCAPGVGNTQPGGNAIFSRFPLNGAQRWTLPSDTRPEQRNLTCVAPTAQPKMHFCTTHITTNNDTAPNGKRYNENQLDFVLGKMEAFNSAGDTAVIAGDFNAQPHYGRLNNWYSPTLNVAGNSGNTGAYRELDDNDAGNCLGYGEWSATGTPGATPPCGGLAKIDLIFARQNRLAGSYNSDSLSISTGCSGIPATSAYAAGSCSDHRIVIGTATVSIG